MQTYGQLKSYDPRVMILPNPPAGPAGQEVAGTPPESYLDGQPEVYLESPKGEGEPSVNNSDSPM